MRGRRRGFGARRIKQQFDARFTAVITAAHMLSEARPSSGGPGGPSYRPVSDFALVSPTATAKTEPVAPLPLREIHAVISPCVHRCLLLPDAEEPSGAAKMRSLSVTSCFSSRHAGPQNIFHHYGLLFFSISLSLSLFRLILSATSHGLSRGESAFHEARRALSNTDTTYSGLPRIRSERVAAREDRRPCPSCVRASRATSASDRRNSDATTKCTRRNGGI